MDNPRKRFEHPSSDHNSPKRAHENQPDVSDMILENPIKQEKIPTKFTDKTIICIRCGSNHHVKICPHPKKIKCENCQGHHHMRKCPHLCYPKKYDVLCKNGSNCKYGSQCFYQHSDQPPTKPPPFQTKPQFSVYPI